MTVVAYKEGELAADTVALFGDTKVPDFNKITNIHNSQTGVQHLIGMAGVNVPDIEEAANWFLRVPVVPFKPEDSEFNLLVVEGPEDPRIFNIRSGGQMLEINVPFFAIGCGMEAAMAAMECGASAAEAVEVCVKWVDGCNGDVAIRRFQ